jgi:hypothetical protein
MAKNPLTALLAALLLAVVTSPAPASEDSDPKKKSAPDPEPYRALASRATPGTPEIDGRLDEAVWALAEPILGFVQRDPDEGEPATERTQAWVLYDDGSLYIGVRAYDSEPDKIVGELTRRDKGSASDWIVVSIDSYHDRRTAFEFRVNPAGVERDTYRYDDTNQDYSWNAVWDVATSIDDEGWVAEFRIPFSQLRFSEAPEQTWGFNIERVIQRKAETVQWKPIPKDASGWVSEYGELIGINGITPPRRLEVLPYAVATQGYTPADPGNPFQTGSEFEGNVGADLRYGLTNSLTLNLTLNPDFGQVEADPSVVNLSAFETFFSEKRPFFLEGANIFRFSLGGGGNGMEQLFYSRRIGRRPQGSADDRGGYVDHPDNTTIIAAAKLSGKSAGGWSVGVLDAVTAQEKALVIDGDGIRHEDVVEPLTNYGVARVQKDFNDGRSAFGAIVTATNRQLPVSLSDLRSSAYSGGIDARHRFWGGDWEVSGQLLGSYVAGSQLAIDETQTSSARYFQRPDASHLDYDPTRTGLAGTSGAFSFRKIGGEHWRGSLASNWVSPGFEVNDIGFQRRADLWRNSAWIQYRENDPGKIFRRYSINWNAWNWQTFGGERTATGTNINGSFTLLNYWGGWGGINRQFESTSTNVLRGGPSMLAPGSLNWWAGFYSDDRKPISLEIGTFQWMDDERSSSRGGFLFMSWRPRANLRLTIGPEYDKTHDDWAWVGAEEALGSTRYLMGALDQKTIYLTTRLDWTFTPNLSLQLYAQPFISAGNYTAFNEVVDPHASAYDDRFDWFEEDRLSYEPSNDPDNPGTYHVDLNRDGENDLSFDDPNFNFKQFRSTVVLRWEYLAGSTVFFVWSSSKTAFDFTGEFDPIGDLDRLRQAEGENYFSIKVNYYLNP